MHADDYVTFLYQCRIKWMLGIIRCKCEDISHEKSREVMRLPKSDWDFMATRAAAVKTKKYKAHVWMLGEDKVRSTTKVVGRSCQ